MFIIDWISQYMNTPQQDMTADIEALYYLALIIIMVIAAVIVTAGALVVRFFRKRR